MLKSGLYEQVINRILGKELDTAEDKFISTAPIDKAEASRVLAKYIAEVVEKGLSNVLNNGGDVEMQVSLANKIISTVIEETGESDFASLSIDERAEQLLALLDKKNSIYGINEKAEVVRPETSLLISSLFTGAVHESSMFAELKKETLSSDRIDMLVSFIKWEDLVRFHIKIGVRLSMMDV